MHVDIQKLNELIEEKFRGNKTFFAETIGVDRAYLSQILNRKADSKSVKLCNAIIKFCEKNNLDYKDYIFLD